jgi:hypothetical protein
LLWKLSQACFLVITADDWELQGDVLPARRDRLLTLFTTHMYCAVVCLVLCDLVCALQQVESWLHASGLLTLQLLPTCVRIAQGAGVPTTVKVALCKVLA